MERFKKNYILFPLYLAAFKNNWDVMANEISKLRSKNKVEGGDGCFHISELDAVVRKMHGGKIFYKNKK